MSRRLSVFSMPRVSDSDVINILKREAELRPAWADVQNRWGLHHFSLGDWDEARRFFAKALEINENYAWARLNLAATLWMTGDREGAWSQHAQAPEWDPAKCLTAGWMHLLQGDLDEAFQDVSQVNEDSDQRPDVLWLKTALAEAHGDESASRLWHVLLSDRVVMEGPEAIATMKENASPDAVTGLFPGLHEYWKGVSTIQARLGQNEEAVFSLRLGYLFFSNPAKFLNQMAYIASSQGDENTAVAYYNDSIRSDSKDTDAAQELARYWFANGDITRAREYMRIALNRGPSYPDLHREMGQIEAATDNVDAALECVQRALSINPNYKTAQLEEAFYLFSLERWNDSARAYKRSLEFNLQSSDVYLHLGRCFEHLGDAQKAEEAYKASISLNPEEVLSYYRLSVLYHNNGQPTLSDDTWNAYEKLADSELANFPPDAHFFVDDEEHLHQQEGVA